MMFYYHISFLWKRVKNKVWTPQCVVTDKHPYNWDLWMRRLEREASQIQPNLSHPELNEEHVITWWKEITEADYNFAQENAMYS